MGYVLPTWVGDKQLQPTLLESLDSSVLARLLQQHRSFGQQQQGMCEQPQQQESGDHGQLGEQHTAPSDASSTTTGPTRVEAPAGAVASLPAGVALSQLLGPSNMTLLHLPLKPGSEDVGQKLAQLRPTLLLFLRQLRCLVLSDAEAGTVSKQVPQLTVAS
jgi:hypothetical protein